MDIILGLGLVILAICLFIDAASRARMERRLKKHITDSMLLIDDRLRKRIENRIGNPPEAAPRQAVADWIKEVCGE